MPEDTIFDFGTPASADSGDTQSANLGVKFTADTSGQVLGIRFYKAFANSGTHTGTPMDRERNAAGHRDVHAARPASGWQTVLFSSPVSITAGATYVASYFDPNGHYSYSPSALTSAIDNPPLHAHRDRKHRQTASTTTAPPSSFPTSTYNANNYWVDVLFQPTPPGQVTGVTATAGTSGGDRQLDRTERWRRDELQGHALHRQHGAVADDGDRHSAGHERHHHRAAAGHLLHVHGSSDQRPGVRSSLGSIERGDADRADVHRMRLPG